MVIYVDIEHNRLKQNKEMWNMHLALLLQTKYNIEEASGDHCLIVRYDQISPDLLDQLGATAVCVSGNMTEFQHYDEAQLAGLRQIFKRATRPTIAFCGGMQMMGETFGSRAAAIDESEVGNMDDHSWKNRTHESGYLSVHKTADHPLWEGLGEEIEVMEAHYWELKSVPAGFDTFAATDMTPIQLMVHRSLPLVGTQFHPEEFDEQHPDGRKFLENFFTRFGS